VRRLVTTGPATDSGHPLDSDLHNMTDDGCPLDPDPARWTDDNSRDNLGESDVSDGPPGGQAAPAHTDPRPSRPTPPWTPRSSEGPSRHPRRVDRAGRLRSLGGLLGFVLLLTAAAYAWGGRAEGGWYAAAGWVALGALTLVSVGWVLELIGARGIERGSPKRPTRRRA
jgi:hypothetical protein